MYTHARTHADKHTRTQKHAYPSKSNLPPMLARPLLQIIALTRHFTRNASLYTSE